MANRITTRSTATTAIRVLVAMLCVVLILLVGAAQLLHTHAPNESAGPVCSLCAVAHLAVQPAPVEARGEPVVLVAQVPLPETVHAPPRYFAPAYSVRPPPVLPAPF